MSQDAKDRKTELSRIEGMIDVGRDMLSIIEKYSDEYCRPDIRLSDHGREVRRSAYDLVEDINDFIMSCKLTARDLEEIIEKMHAEPENEARLS